MGVAVPFSAIVRCCHRGFEFFCECQMRKRVQFGTEHKSMGWMSQSHTPLYSRFRCHFPIIACSSTVYVCWKNARHFRRQTPVCRCQSGTNWKVACCHTRMTSYIERKNRNMLFTRAKQYKWRTKNECTAPLTWTGEENCRQRLPFALSHMPRRVCC